MRATSLDTQAYAAFSHGSEVRPRRARAQRALKPPRSHRALTRCAQSAESSGTDADASQKIKPDWAGEDFLSKVVNGAISNKWLYEGLMKPMARNTLIQTAEKNGINWRGNATTLEGTTAVYEQKEALENTGLDYPDYYLQPFHAYSEGNLCWQAAFEAESATYSMALRVWPKDDLTWEAAQDRLRASYIDCIEDHIRDRDLPPPKEIIDMGCSVGISTRAIHQRFPDARMTGLDLSAYMLAVAAQRDADAAAGAGQYLVGRPVTGERTWMHARAEDTGLASASVDLVSLAFVLHECPHAATRDIVGEAARLLRPGGVLVLSDNDPSSPVIQNLPPALFTLMKSTEPHSDDYYTLDIEQTLRDAGFKDVHTVRSDPRHRTVLGTRC